MSDLLSLSSLSCSREHDFNFYGNCSAVAVVVTALVVAFDTGGGGKVGGGGDGGGGGGIDDVGCYVGFVKLLRKINLGGGESEKSNGQNM